MEVSQPMNALITSFYFSIQSSFQKDLIFLDYVGLYRLFADNISLTVDFQNTFKIDIFKSLTYSSHQSDNLLVLSTTLRKVQIFSFIFFSLFWHMHLIHLFTYHLLHPIVNQNPFECIAVLILSIVFFKWYR